MYNHDGPFFTGTLMKLSASRKRAEIFNLFQIQIDGENATTIRGDGLLSHFGPMAVSGATVFGGVLGDSSTATSASVQLRLTSSERDNHLEAHTDSALVFQLNSKGDITSKGKLNLANGTFRIEDEGAIMLDATIQRNLDVTGQAFVREEIRVGAPTAPSVLMSATSGVKVITSQSMGAVLEVVSANDDGDAASSSSVLRLQSTGSNLRPKSLIQALNNDETVFDVDSLGFVKMAHLHLKSGGMVVESGGMSVQAGGITVNGGLTVNSGALHLGSEGLELSRLAVSNRIHYNASLLSAQSVMPNYAGVALDLSVKGSAKDFSFIEARGTEGSALFRVDGHGFIESSSGASLAGDRGLFVHGHSVLKGGVSFSRLSVLAGPQIFISSNSSLVEILDDGAVAANDLVVDEGSPKGGHVLLISNKDAQCTGGFANIESGGVMMFIFDGGEWRGIQALQTSVKELLDVKKLTASNDLAIGYVGFSAGSLSAAGLSKGRLVVSEEGGLLTSHTNLKFVKGVLSSPALKVRTVHIHSSIHVAVHASIHASFRRAAAY